MGLDRQIVGGNRTRVQVGDVVNTSVAQYRSWVDLSGERLDQSALMEVQDDVRVSVVELVEGNPDLVVVVAGGVRKVVHESLVRNHGTFSLV